MKKIVLVAAMLMATIGLKAQTNIQEMYDFNRGHYTTTLEMFKSDNWGSTFFFNDIYHTDNIAPTDYYTEIARAFNFWQKSKLGALSLHLEWNGGSGIYPILGGFGGYPVNNAWLYGVEYFIHSADFSKTLTLEVLYKDIRGGSSDIPLQLTAVWGINNLFGVEGLTFSGFADFWWENHVWYYNLLDQPAETTTTVFLTEPQIWYNIGKFFKCENLNIGGEVEISNNFSGNKKGESGWDVNLCFGIKWVF